MDPLPSWTSGYAVGLVGDFGFTAFYLAAFALWVGPRALRVLAPVRAAGQMALTNYH